MLYGLFILNQSNIHNEDEVLTPELIFFWEFQGLNIPDKKTNLLRAIYCLWSGLQHNVNRRTFTARLKGNVCWARGLSVKRQDKTVFRVDAIFLTWFGNVRFTPQSRGGHAESDEGRP